MTEATLFFLLGMLAAFMVVLARQRFAAFYGQTAEDYEDDYPILDIKENLRGEMICEGVIFGPMGRVTSTFRADFRITWEGDKGVMSERFHYNDGSLQDRAWHIELGRDGHFSCEADDVPGGGKGFVAGPTVRMVYKIRLPEESGGHILDTRDWMYLTPGGTIVNRSQFRKYGFKVAELVATIRPKESA
ncbi:MAG: DUF3833 family protein [Sulfitobacter sp.]|nr:DUF3833 family protein [Sulfitobacter sp.]